MPNAQATIDATATFYLNQGVLGATCVLLLLLMLGVCWIARGLSRALQSCQEARVTDAKLSTEALIRQSSTNAEIATISSGLREGQVEVMRMVALIQRDTENGDDRTKDKIEGLTKALEDLGRRLEGVCRGGPR